MKVNWEAKATKVVALGSLEPGELVRHTAGHIEGAYIVTDQGAEGQTEVVRLNDGAWYAGQMRNRWLCWMRRLQYMGCSMNKTRRKAIDDVVAKLQELRDEVESLRDEEQDYYDNMPESFQNGEKGGGRDCCY